MCIERYSVGGSEKETRKITNVKLNYRLPWIFIRSAFYRADDRCNLTSFYFRSHGQIRAWSCEDYRSLRVVSTVEFMFVYLFPLRVFFFFLFLPFTISILMKNNVSTNCTCLTIKNYMIEVETETCLILAFRFLFYLLKTWSVFRDVSFIWWFHIIL